MAPLCRSHPDAIIGADSARYVAFFIVLDFPDVDSDNLGIVQVGCQPFCGNDGSISLAKTREKNSGVRNRVSNDEKQSFFITISPFLEGCSFSSLFYYKALLVRRQI